MSNSISATTLEHAPLEAVFIYFDTATYDEIKRDEKVQALFYIVYHMSDEKVLFWIHLFLESTLCL